jgi:hypothetical protein
METRSLGHNGPRMSVVGLGCNNSAVTVVRPEWAVAGRSRERIGEMPWM